MDLTQLDIVQKVSKKALNSDFSSKVNKEDIAELSKTGAVNTN